METQKGNVCSTPLPKKDLPISWWDDDEVSYYFSPFRATNQHPEDKDTKIKFWMPLINKWCDHEMKCTFTLSELERTFTKNQLVPACLSGVVDEMLRKHQLCEKNQFLLLPPQTWSGWAVDLLIRKPVGWSFRKVKTLITKTEEEEIYVVLEATKLQAEILLNRVKKANKGQLLLQSEVKKIASDLKDLEIILHWLRCHNRVVNAKHKDEEIIKFCDETKPTPISDTEMGIFALLRTEENLSKDMEELEAERLNVIQSAKNYVEKGMKQMAKRSLKKKQEIEKNLDKRALVLENVQSLLFRIKESHSDAKILDTYQQGIAALKFTLKEAKLTDENVSNTMLELNEVLDIHNEIQESMTQPTEISNDEELEEELEKLLLSKNEPDSLESFNIKDLPDVPRQSPSQPTTKSQLLSL